MSIGIREYTNPNEADRLDGMPWLSFRGELKDCAINRRNYADAAAR